MPNSENGDEDDYLSEKFLNPPAHTATGKKRSHIDLSYNERRREAQRLSDLRNQSGRIRSRREVEEEARREGLSRSLFERAREEEENARKRRKVSGEDEEDDDRPEPVPIKNKAMAMMLKMGYKEGESLGRKDPPPDEEEETQTSKNSALEASTEGNGIIERNGKASGHLVEPLPLAVWAGRKGLGLGKRIFAVEKKALPSLALNGIPEPHVTETQEAYRNRTRMEFEERRDAGRVEKARKTLVELDEKHGVQFNILWIDPQDVSTIPPRLVELLEDPDGAAHSSLPLMDDRNRTAAEQLRAQMQADALEPLETDLMDEGRLPLPMSDASKPKKVERKAKQVFNEDTVQDTRDWLLLNARQRLHFTLEHLRKQYAYCFWCGAKYEDAAELAELCPGEDEEAHD